MVAEAFSLQKAEMLEEVVVGERSVNMVGEAKLCSPILSTFEALVVQRAVRSCRGELGPFC